MNVEIVETPFQATLFGFAAEIANGDISKTGKRLMDKMWSEVHSNGIKTKGVNHWVYLPQSRMFAGVQVVDEGSSIGALEKIQIALNRHLRFVHCGEYSTLPQVWQDLMQLLKDQGLKPVLPNLEIYGHWNPNPSQCETTIVIGLEEGAGCMA
ncbi:MAG: GyrI-like domain-containing protein [Pirellulales bacterium]